MVDRPSQVAVVYFVVVEQSQIDVRVIVLIIIIPLGFKDTNLTEDFLLLPDLKLRTMNSFARIDSKIGSTRAAVENRQMAKPDPCQSASPDQVLPISNREYLKLRPRE